MKWRYELLQITISNSIFHKEVYQCIEGMPLDPHTNLHKGDYNAAHNQKSIASGA